METRPYVITRKKTILTDYQKNKLKKGKCVTLGCRNNKKHGYYCIPCKFENRKKNNHVKIAYESLKSSAKKRGHYFGLTLTYFIQWCKDNKYIELKGRFKNCMSVDRDKPELGYIDGNIKMMTVGENSKKKYTDYYRQLNEVPDDYVPPTLTSIQSNKTQEEENLPF